MTPIKKQLHGLKRGRRRSASDVFLGLAGVSLAAICGYFPFHVNANRALYLPPSMTFERLDVDGQPIEEFELVEGVPRRNASTSTAVVDLGADIDRMVTGSLTPAKPDAATRAAVPSDVQISVVFATDRHALVWDGEDIMPVSVGSVLPDGSSVVRFERLGDNWAIRNSRNEMISQR